MVGSREGGGGEWEEVERRVVGCEWYGVNGVEGEGGEKEREKGKGKRKEKKLAS